MARMKFRPVIDDKILSTEERDARWELWRQGDLSWKLKGKQQEIYDDIVNQSKDVSVILSSRRLGKTFATLIAELEVCLQIENAIVKHACPTQKMVKKMIYPALKVIFHDAPPELNLDSLWNASEGELRFPNGAILTIAGTDGNNADNLRGTYAHLAVADEAGFMDNLDYVIKNILLPLTDTTGGKLVLLSTPNYYNPQHEFHSLYVKPYESSGSLVKLTIFDSPMVNDQERAKIIKRYSKGINDPKFKCEYMVEIPTNTEDSIVPEFYENRHEIIIEKYEEPILCDYYVGGDIGTNDPTGFVFGYYDFVEATVIITDEWISKGAGKELSTAMIATGIKLKEEENFKRTPTKRVIDNNNQILVTDLRVDHGIIFKLTKKDNKMAQINKLRDLISEGRLKISDKCKNLIYQLTCGQWAKANGNKTEFDHLDESLDGELVANHLDLLDSLVYMVRNINLNKNPRKETNATATQNQYGSNKEQNNSPVKDMMRKLTGNNKMKKRN